MFDLIPFAAKSRDLFDSFDRRFWGEGTAALGDFRTDIIEENDKYVLEAELPGFKREDISIDVEDDRLTITAKATASAAAPSTSAASPSRTSRPAPSPPPTPTAS